MVSKGIVSIRAKSGTTFLLIIAFFIWILESKIIANCETSAAVPAVDGMHMSGGPGA